VYSPWGKNFVKSMLRLAATRPSIGVVDDQWGSPTSALHLAGTIIDMAARVVTRPTDARWGIYNAVGSGETTWFGLAQEVFLRAAAQGLPVADVTAIATTGFPTPARRPANSRLNCDKLRQVFGIELPDWRIGVEQCVGRLAASVRDGGS